MYRFTDTIEGYAGSNQLPAEALQINGVFIENVIEGYRTLYVSGREMLAPEINSLELSKRHGNIYRSRRYPARTITVGFQLIASSDSEFRSQFNRLNGILYAEEAQLVFNDEPDKCFYGTLSGIENPEPGKNKVTGEFSFLCSDPFKYSTEEIEATPSADSGRTIIIDYEGTVAARPILEVNFPKHGGNGVCSYLAFTNNSGDIIQIGGVNTSDFDSGDSDAKNLIYEYFYDDLNTMLYCGNAVYCSDSLPCCLSEEWQVNGGTFLIDDYLDVSGTVGVTERGSNGRLAAVSYGSGTHFHGPSVTTIVTNASEGITGFDFTFKNYFKASDISEKGVFIATLNRVADRESVFASVALVKREERQAVDILLIINDAVRKTVTVPLPLSSSSISIAKDGNRFTFTVGGKIYSFLDDTLANVGVHKAGFLFGSYAGEPPMSVNNLEWARLTDRAGDFTNSDAVIADCKSATIKMNNISKPALDVIGNNWESFVLKPGINQIRTAYKTSSSKAPSFKVRYREVFL